MRAKARSVAGYLEEVPEQRRPILRKLRALIRKTVPRAKESMRLGMPTYEVDGAMFCAFASQKAYLALYLCDAAVVKSFGPRLGTRDCGKSCIRYRKPESMPLDLVARVLKAALKK